MHMYLLARFMLSAKKNTYVSFFNLALKDLFTSLFIPNSYWEVIYCHKSGSPGNKQRFACKKCAKKHSQKQRL